MAMFYRFNTCNKMFNQSKPQAKFILILLGPKFIGTTVNTAV